MSLGLKLWLIYTYSKEWKCYNNPPTDAKFEVVPDYTYKIEVL